MTRRVAVELMHRGSVLIKTNGNANVQSEYFVVPGGRVTPLVAEEIMNLPNVRGGKDALWPGLDRTWRCVRC
jgi:hypothetical protein